MEKFYVTTPIYYVNDVPHIGHAYTSIAADAAARFNRLLAKEVFFLTGTDEHGLKVEKTARDNKEEPLQLVNRVCEKFKGLTGALNLTNNDFVRTTEERHVRAVREMFERMKAKGDIYKDKYEGWYCTPCEAYWTEVQLAGAKLCPDCGRQVEKVSEESYFFKLSNYGAKLLEHIEKNPLFILPLSRRNEITSMIKGGLKDLSISRTSFKWGIPVPGDDRHVLYVWVDALTNYLTGAGFPDAEGKPGKYWPCDLHLMGKDIIKFHAVIWPAMLMSADLPLPVKIFAHGWWTVDGQKMSKSLGNVVDPLEMTARFGRDQFRYFLLREVPFGLDGDFSIKSMINRINSDLANDLGNLYYRSLSMLEQFRGGTVPDMNYDSLSENEKNIIYSAESLYDKVTSRMELCKFSEVLTDIWDFINTLNKYIEVSAPWKLNKAKDDDGLNRVMAILCEGLRIVSLYIYPFMPETAEKIAKGLNCGTDYGSANLNRDAKWSRVLAGIKVNKGGPLIARIEAEKPAPAQGPAQTPTAAPSAADGLIDIEDFKKVKLIVARVTAAEKIPKADKLLKLTVDDGRGQGERTIVAGIAQHYEPEALVNRNVILVDNLKPVKLRGIESRGMLLAASSDDKVIILTTEKEAKPGSTIK